MKDAFKIFFEQLRDGHVEHVDEKFSPEEMDLNDADLQFVEPVVVTGEAYLANDELVLHFDVKTKAKIACNICNQPVVVDIELNNFYHAEPLENIKSGVYEFKEILREDVLLNAPHFAECEGNCPRREEVTMFLKPHAEDKTSSSEQEGYQPFADLSLDAIQKPKKKNKSS